MADTQITHVPVSIGRIVATSDGWEGTVTAKSRIPGHWQVERRGFPGTSVSFAEDELTVWTPNAAPQSISRHF